MKHTLVFHPAFPSLITISFIAACLLIFLSLTTVIVQAETADRDEMKNVAENWVTYIVSQTGGWAGSPNPYIVDEQDLVVDDTLLAKYYTVSSGGYVIVPVLKELPPVKAYSEENPLDIYEADGFALMLRQVLQHRTQLFAEVYGSLEATQDINEPLFDISNRAKWNQLAISPKEYAASADKSPMEPMEGVGPLLTTTWTQGAPYNNLCPMGDGGRTVVGCVATAAAQIIYYHQWPPYGEGSHGYTWGGDNSCGGSTPSQYLTADFSDQYVYDGSAASVAEISYEMGVAFNMDYGACGSGAYTMDGATVFPTYFRYDASAQAKYRDNYTQSAWFELIKSNINKNRPLLYRIYSHAIVCDGWRVSGVLDQYHFNYGWGGSQNVWYAVDNLYCPWSGCDPMVEAMVVNIIPENGSPWLSGSELTDELGDGDNIPEAGETIDMVVTVANYGGAAVTDVTMDLTIDDASLTVIDGSTTIGTINANDSAGNTSDPFSFSIPADYVSRLDTFMIEITWNGGSESDTLFIEKAIGAVSILLVDDDDNSDRDEYYREALEYYRIPYDVWEFAAFSTPDATYLSKYDIVMWFTGDYRTYPISGPEIASISGYLDNGGNLFFTGQRIAAQLSTFDPSFLSNYLKASYVGTQYVPVLNTEDGNVFTSGYQISIQGSNSAANQGYPDFIAPTGGGIAELKYIGSDWYGAVSYSGAYKSLFFSFGFEAVASGDSRWRDRASVMADILSFFGYQLPDAYPVVSNIVITPGDPMHLIDHTPTISWTYGDEGGSPQTYYQVQVGTDNAWSTAEMWDSGPLSGTATAIDYDGTALVDGGYYYTRIRVHNGTVWSDWLSRTMRMNSVPDPATDLSPANLSAVTSALPTLTHANAYDGENDNLTYSYEVYADSEMTQLMEQVFDHPSGVYTTSCTMTTPLTDNSVYYWRVEGADAFEEGAWTDLASFWVNSVNSPPEAFELLSPANGTQLPDRQPEFSWSATADLDLYDDVTYTLYYSTDPNFGTKVTVGGLETTGYTPTTLLDYGLTYYWKVRAQDKFSGTTYCNEVFSFTTINRGDANGDGTINVADAVFLIGNIFNGGPNPNPLLSGDANCDGGISVGDVVTIINYIFKGGAEPGCH